MQFAVGYAILTYARCLSQSNGTFALCFLEGLTGFSGPEYVR